MTTESAEQDQLSEIPDTAASRGQRFAQVLHAIEAEARAQGIVVSRRSVAKQAGVTSPAVTAWFKASQMPRADKLEAIAEVYAAGDAQRLQRIRQKLHDAAGSELSAPIARSPLERLEGGIIRIGLLDYTPVSGFLNQLFTAFSKSAHFEAAIAITPSVTSLMSQAGSDRMNGDRLDIISGIFATPKRAQNFHFIETPLAMGVNALTFGKRKGDLKAHEANDLHAEDPSGRRRGRRPIMPIVSVGESGHLFARSVLGFKEHEMHVCDYSARELKRALVDAANGDRVPLVIADELAILNIYEILIEELAAGELDFEKLGAPAVLMAADSGRETTTNEVYPIFNIPLCVAKHIDRKYGEEWFHYVRNAWSIFIKSNVRFVAAAYGALRYELNDRVTQMGRVVEGHREMFGDPVRAAELLADIESTWRGKIESWLFNELPDWSAILEEVRESILEEARRKVQSGDPQSDLAALKQEGSEIADRLAKLAGDVGKLAGDVGKYVERVNGLALRSAASDSPADGDGK